MKPYEVYAASILLWLLAAVLMYFLNSLDDFIGSTFVYIIFRVADYLWRHHK